MAVASGSATAPKIWDPLPQMLWRCTSTSSQKSFAIAGGRKGGETGVAGVEWAQEALEALAQTKGPVIDFVAATEPGSDEHYLQQPWGAYGAAYASQLYEIGIFNDAKGHTIPVPSE